MSREDAHKMLDKVLVAGYCGKIIFDCFKGNVTMTELDQFIKSPNELIMVAVV